MEEQLNKNGETPHQRLVIVGGGTAGWLSALFINRYLGNEHTQVTLIESPLVPSIGVGEGSTGLLTTILRDPAYGVEESAFIRDARATFKLGIAHQGWRQIDHTYLGPIDNPASLLPELSPLGLPVLQAYAVSKGFSVVDAHLNGRLINAGLSPVLLRNDKIELLPTYAYHFDASAAAKFLSNICVSRGVRYVQGSVTEVQLDEQGSIKKLILDNHNSVEGDFFIDCSGFGRILIQKALGSRWISWRGYLPVDSAIVLQYSHDPRRDIPVATLARALSAGWLWGIPTQDRMGYGYVFSSYFKSPEDATLELESALGVSAAPHRLIRFESGRLERVWIHNCVAIGLASAFAEPLEATSIHSILLQLILLCTENLTPVGATSDPARIEKYNGQISGMYDSFRDFIILHYRTNRRDSSFWRFVSQIALPETLVGRLEIWKNRFPCSQHFKEDCSFVSPGLYLPILDGLGLLGQATARASIAEVGLNSFAEHAWKAIENIYGDALRFALPHRDALSAVGIDPL